MINSPTRATWALPTILLVPVWIFAIDPGGLVPTMGLRTALTFSTVAVVVAHTLWQSSARPLGAKRASAARHPHHQMVRSLTVMLAIWVLAASNQGTESLHAWIGTPDRRWGAFAYGITGAAAWVGWRHPHWWVSLCRSGAIGGVALGIVATTEFAGLQWPGSLGLDGRQSSLFGQPAFLGSAAAFLGFIAAADMVRSRSKVAAVGTVGAAVALVGSGTRGALLAVAVGIVFIVPRRRLAMVGASPFVVFAVVQARSWSRFDEWTVAYRALVDSPIFGYGPEGYRTVFGRFVTTDYVDTYGYEVFTDRAHQGLLDHALSIGVVGVVLLIALAVSFVRPLWKPSIVPHDLRLGAVACGVYLLAQQVLFPIAYLEPLVAVFCGVIVARMHTLTVSSANSIIMSPDSTTPAVGARLITTRTLAMASLLCASAIGFYGWNEGRAERALAAEADTFQTDATVVTEAVARRPDSIRVQFAAARLLARSPSLLDLDHAIDHLEAGLDVSPSDPALLLEYARLLRLRAVRSGLDEDDAIAAAAANQASAALPLHPEARALLVAAND